ncbi:hypothetical protein [Zunongwangia profunda]|uniref:hypothetical protein n=1 Tax=Zunongwangia profunda TaxID=398743 RepID=UPI001D17E785|nr:hypothetical protein [Zunongwangia profunda]MCC4227314.1 hypothetical protein [Zunongwangia profunda]
MTQKEKIIERIKKGIWLYFLLLFFEGALRKWILPQLATPLLIVRDPIAIWLLVQCLQYNIWKPNGFVITAWLVTILSFAFTFIVGHGNLFVAIYGMRIMLLHFPLIFIIGRILTYEDLEKMGKVLLWITIGMTILVALQFYTPQSSFVNRGIAGEEGSGFSGAAGFYRVPGTFSFTNGLSLFYGLAGCFVVYFLVRKKSIVIVPKYLLIASVVALIAAIPLSISRSVFFQLLLTIIFVVFITGKNPKILFRILGGAIVIITLLVVLQNFEFFQTATMAFTERFTKANEIEGGTEGVLVDRFLGGLIEPLKKTSSIFGKGLGLGTNAGARLLTGERGLFMISEDEWGRILGERGFILGLIIIMLRLILSSSILLKSWKRVSNGNILPWILVSFSAIKLLNGQLAQPTNLGFVVISVGFTIAALKYSDT